MPTTPAPSGPSNSISSMTYIYRSPFSRYELTRDHRSVVFHGTVESGRPDGAVAALSANLISANLTAADGRRYQVRWAGPDVYRVQEMDPGKLPALTGSTPA